MGEHLVAHVTYVFLHESISGVDRHVVLQELLSWPGVRAEFTAMRHSAEENLSQMWPKLAPETWYCWMLDIEFYWHVDWFIYQSLPIQLFWPKKLNGEKGNQQPLHSREAVAAKSTESRLISFKSMGKWGLLRVGGMDLPILFEEISWLLPDFTATNKWLNNDPSLVKLPWFEPCGDGTKHWIYSWKFKFCRPLHIVWEIWMNMARL